MSCLHLDQVGLSPPTYVQSVYREDCTECFDSIDDLEGLNVCLHCFNGGCAGERLHSIYHAKLARHPIALNIRRTQKRDCNQPPLKITKLAIPAKKEDDIYDYSLAVKCLECNEFLNKDDIRLQRVVDGIINANTFARKAEVEAWEHELVGCEHIQTLQQLDPRTIPSGELAHCSDCMLRQNLWLCLLCGNLACGRKQVGGVDGNSHAIAHSISSGHVVAVKLGSITPEGTADIYCYSCNDDRIDEALGAHLAHWGIMLSERQRTEKSLTELQIEQNLSWDFSMTTEDGKIMTPLFGPGLTGLRNLGNTCYISSIIQCLFATNAFKEYYYPPQIAPSSITAPAEDVEIQLRKLADGIWSGRYSKPNQDCNPVADTGETAVVHQNGLSPSIFRHLVGRGHAEFSTMRQQDAFEFLQHLLKLINRCKQLSVSPRPTKPFSFVMEQRLQCVGCKRVRYSQTDQDNILIDVPLEKLPTVNGNHQTSEYKAITLKQCLDAFTAPVAVDLTCASCGSKDGFTKRTLFKTFPETLIVNARKMTIINWVPLKVDVPLLLPDEFFDLDEYLSRGLQPAEQLLPEESDIQQPAFVPNSDALAQLEAMGFSRNRCERSLHATGNADASAAMEWLFSHMEDANIDTPLNLKHGSTSANADPEKAEMLGAMGFSAPQVTKALGQTGGDVERAIEWLFNHPDDEEIPATTDDTPTSVTPAAAAEDRLPARYQLQSIVCHKGNSIHSGHYVAFVRKDLPTSHSGLSPSSPSTTTKPTWVLFNDEKVVEAPDFDEMKKFAYVYFFQRIL